MVSYRLVLLFLRFETIFEPDRPSYKTCGRLRVVPDRLAESLRTGWTWLTKSQNELF